MTTISSVYCYACNKQLDLIAEQKILRNQECDHCQAQLHCCKMCIHYDKTTYNECREPTAERIVEKEKANFCGHFKISACEKDTASSKKNLFSDADKLFKG